MYVTELVKSLKDDYETGNIKPLIVIREYAGKIWLLRRMIRNYFEKDSIFRFIQIDALLSPNNQTDLPDKLLDICGYEALEKLMINNINHGSDFLVSNHIIIDYEERKTGLSLGSQVQWVTLPPRTHTIQIDGKSEKISHETYLTLKKGV